QRSEPCQRVTPRRRVVLGTPAFLHFAIGSPSLELRSMLSFATLIIALGVSPVAPIVQPDTILAKNDTALPAVSAARAAASTDSTFASSLASPLFQPVTLTALDTVRRRRPHAVQM